MEHKTNCTKEPTEAEPAEPAAETAEGGDEDAAAKEREARALASIQERKKEVQRALAPSMRDRDKEREQHRRDEAIQHFTALMADLVRDAELSWRDAKKQLKKDHRYSLAHALSKEDKERLFNAHIQSLSEKRRGKLRALLEELAVPSEAHWKDVKGQLKDDPRTPKYSDPDKMERDFRDYQRDRLSAAKAAFRSLLQESRGISHTTHGCVRASRAARAALLDALRHDARYTALDQCQAEREQLLMGYLEELQRKGPPPPPTATEPHRRTK